MVNSKIVRSYAHTTKYTQISENIPTYAWICIIVRHIATKGANTHIVLYTSHFSKACIDMLSDAKYQLNACACE